MRPSLFLPSLVLLAACGGTVATTSGNASDAGSGNDAAAADASCTPAPAHCVCGGNPACMAGQWVCPSATTCADASGPLGCGPSLVCSTGTQYCQESSGGPPPLPDSGPAVGYGCESFPPDCASDHSCACLRAHGACGGGAAAQCASIDGGVTIQCAFP